MMATAIIESVSPLTFALPSSLEAHEPPEARGLARDEVRLMVSYLGDDAVTHTRFTSLPSLLRRGDVLVVNESATVNAALPATRASGQRIELHLSQRLSGRQWVVELREPTADRGTVPLYTAARGETILLPAGASIQLIEPYGERLTPSRTRLWLASAISGDVDAYLDRYGAPIRYGYVTRAWPLSYYQTIFARDAGSAEMPSAGRPFSRRVVAELVHRGIRFAPIVLHTGVSSLEEHEPPYAEYFRVGDSTARIVNDARRAGGRIIAVGTTAVRALESVASADGTVTAGSDWTELIVTPDRGIHAVDGLITGFHEPRASHLAMLEALAGRDHLESAYAAALSVKYLWHEFGDVHLLLPGRRVDN
jgi:S-adenosylmethionine:tRNA ribosyltransferase-isomerase